MKLDGFFGVYAFFFTQKGDPASGGAFREAYALFIFHGLVFVFMSESVFSSELSAEYLFSCRALDKKLKILQSGRQLFRLPQGNVSTASKPL